MTTKLDDVINRLNEIRAEYGNLTFANNCDDGGGAYGDSTLIDGILDLNDIEVAYSSDLNEKVVRINIGTC